MPVSDAVLNNAKYVGRGVFVFFCFSLRLFILAQMWLSTTRLTLDASQGEWACKRRHRIIIDTLENWVFCYFCPDYGNLMSSNLLMCLFLALQSVESLASNYYWFLTQICSFMSWMKHKNSWITFFKSQITFLNIIFKNTHTADILTLVAPL